MGTSVKMHTFLGHFFIIFEIFSVISGKNTASCNPPSSSSNNWSYVQNSGSSLTADVWFTAVKSDNLDWNSAKSVCSSIGDGVVIGSVLTSDETGVVASLNSGSLWLSGYYDESGTWYWIYGGKGMNELFSYTNWGSGFPSGSDNRMTVVDSSSGVWSDQFSNQGLDGVVCMVRCQTNYS